MFNKKKIIILSGKIGSGKSFMLSIFKNNTKTLCIDCDKVVAKLMSKKRRTKLLTKCGIEILEAILYPKIKSYIMKQIIKTKHNLVAIEGIKAKEMFKSIMDVEIIFNVSKRIRQNRCLMRGDSLEKFNYFENLQKNL